MNTADNGGIRTLTMVANNYCLSEKKREEATSRGGYVVEEEKSGCNDNHGTRDRRVRRKAARKK